MIHAKKILPEYFEASLKGLKPFEIREEKPNEPRYSVGDYLALNEWEPEPHGLGDGYTGRCLLYEITYVLRDYELQQELLQPGAVVLGLKLKPLSFEDLPGALRPI